MIKLAIKKIMLVTTVKIPPKEPTLEIESIPCVVKNVEIKMNKIPKIPITSVDDKPNIDQCCVVSLPKINAENVIQIREAVDTIQTIQDANQINVPMKDFITSPNPQFQTPIAIISFVVYAIFAYGGMESLGSVTDSMDKPEKTFPRGLIIASLFTIGAYVIMIFMIGFSVNYNSVVAKHGVNLGNITYIVFNQLGVYLGHSLGWSAAASHTTGMLITRFVALTQVLGFLGAMFILLYSPIKSFILGSDKRLWPEKLTRLNKHNMPANAMWLQAIIVCVIIFLVAFGGSAAQRFYLILIDMANVSTSFPYLFLVGAFPFFKKKKIEHSFVAFKNPFWTNLLVIIIEIILSAGIIFTCVQPILDGDFETAFWTIAGPVFFGLVAFIFYQVSSKKHKMK